MSTTVLAPLDGDAIEHGLALMGLDDADTFAICLAAGITAAEMDVVADLSRDGDPAPRTADSGTDTERWNSLFSLVTDFGLDVSAIRALRGRGLSDLVVLYAAEVIGDMALVTDLAARGHHWAIREPGEWVDALTRAGVPLTDMPLWADAGFATEGVEHWQWLPVVQLWRDRLGEDAAACAAAGLTLEEAASGAWDADGLAVLRALRQAG